MKWSQPSLRFKFFTFTLPRCVLDRKKHVWFLPLLDFQKRTNWPGTSKALVVQSQDFHCARSLSSKESADVVFVFVTSSSSPPPFFLGLFFSCSLIELIEAPFWDGCSRRLTCIATHPAPSPSVPSLFLDSKLSGSSSSPKEVSMSSTSSSTPSPCPPPLPRPLPRPLLPPPCGSSLPDTTGRKATHNQSPRS